MPRVLFAGLCAMLGNFVYAQFEPILALRLQEFNATTIQTGTCMSIYGFVYIIGTLLVPQIPDRVQKRFTLMSGAFFMGIFLFLVGPSQILGFNESLMLLIIGLFITA